MQADGNLVVYKHAQGGKTAIWNVGSPRQDVFGSDRWAQLFDEGSFVVGPDQGAWRSRVYSTGFFGQPPGEREHIIFTPALA